MKYGKRLVILTIMFFLTFLSFQAVSAKDSEKQYDEEVTARVATYNVQAGIGMDDEYDLDRLADTIREMDADVIGLQEVDVHWGDRSENENTIKLLAEKLGMEYYFAPIYDLDPDQGSEDRKQYGVAVLSKYPIKETANREITRLSTQDPDSEPESAPGFLEAKIDIDGADTWFYVTHLDYRSNPEVRETQVDEMLHIMEEHDYPILVGDMNANPEAPELQPLFRWFDDAWMNSDQTGSGYTFPADSPDKRIDYILSSKRMNVENTTVDSSQTSDHFPVSTDVTLACRSHSLSTKGMKMLVDAYQEQGEISDDKVSHLLTTHLQAISHYEKHGNSTKAIKHMQTLSSLLAKKKDEEIISEKAYETLQEDAEYLTDKWKK